MKLSYTTLSGSFVSIAFYDFMSVSHYHRRAYQIIIFPFVLWGQYNLSFAAASDNGDDDDEKRNNYIYVDIYLTEVQYRCDDF